jgi:hypothetical protein
LVGYYRKFVKNFGVIAKPLTTLLNKHVVFVWTSEHGTAFALLKSALSSALVLGLPNFTKQFAIETDASGAGVGAILLQNSHPLAYVSKPLGVKNMGLSAYEKEYLAILLAVDHWRSYLQHGTFLIFMDQRSLTRLNEQCLKTPWQQHVFTKLLGLQYQVVYKQGSNNGAADALSRCPHSPISLNAISVGTPNSCQMWWQVIIKILTPLNCWQICLLHLPQMVITNCRTTFFDTKAAFGLVTIQPYNNRSYLHCMTVQLGAILVFQSHTVA